MRAQPESSLRSKGGNAALLPVRRRRVERCRTDMNATTHQMTSKPEHTRPLPLLSLCTLACPLVIAFVCTASAVTLRTTPDEKSDLLETGSASTRPPSAPVLPAEIKIVSYNMRWRGGDELRRLIVMLREDAEIGGAAIIGLQEVDRNKQRTGNVNTARTIAEALGMNYAWAAPPQVNDGQEEETGVAILSSYPMTNVERIVLPNEGPGKRRRVALGATLRIGTTDVRVYSVHAETRIPVEKKMEQLHAVLKDLQRRPKTEQAIVLGDFNTIKGKDVRACVKLFTDEGLTAAIPHDQATWKTFIFKLKLDWVWLRALEATGSGIVQRITLSDHWPLWVRVKFGGDSKSIQPPKKG